jgi:hypothetical protein
MIAHHTGGPDQSKDNQRLSWKGHVWKRKKINMPERNKGVMVRCLGGASQGNSYNAVSDPAFPGPGAEGGFRGQ